MLGAEVAHQLRHQHGALRVHEGEADLFASLRRESPTVYSGVNLQGVFAGGMDRWGPRREAWRALFAPAPKLRPLLDRAARQARQRGATLVAVHIRRRDYGYGRYWVAPARWYVEWLNELWPRLDAPVLYVASDDPQAVESFAGFSPLHAADLGVAIPGAEFFVDHWLLRQADHLAIANSTKTRMSSSAAAPNPRSISTACGSSTEV